NVSRTAEMRLLLQRDREAGNAFSLTDPRLKDRETGPGGSAFARAAKKVVLWVDRQRHEVTFASLVKRQMELRTTANWVLRPRIRKIAGVAQVIVLGGGRKQYQVLVDPRALLDHDVTLHEVEEALRESNVSASGGFLERGDRELPAVVHSRLGPGT